MDTTSGEVTLHVVLLGESPLATFEGTFKIFPVFMTSSDMFGEISFV